MHPIDRRRASSAALAALVTLAAQAPARSPAPAPPEAQGQASADLRAALEKEGLTLDLEHHLLAIPATIQIRSDLLEYLLVGPNGAGHESLFLTRVRPSLVNAALLLLGVQPGKNARWEEEEGLDEEGRPKHKVYPPEGDGFYLYAAWRESGETFFYRVEDLVRNLASGRSLKRHRWVFLGSRFAKLRPSAPEVFVADVEGNLVNLSYFFQGNTLLTAVPDECIEQTIWAANEWLVPAQGQPVRLFFSRAPLDALDPAWSATLPEVAASEDVPGPAGHEPRGPH